MLRKLFEYYLKNQQSLVSRYDGRYIVIRDDSVVADFDNEQEALFYAKKNFEPGTFIVQRCTAGDSDYTQAYMSRVIFA
jgi:hypothetical protein